MGFFTLYAGATIALKAVKSQSLSGWDGVFHAMSEERKVMWIVFESQSLSGWDGVFHQDAQGVSN